MIHQQTETLFHQIGGMPAVNQAVEIFYAKVIDDERVNHFFATTDMQMQKQRLKAFLAYAFGANLPYTGKSMRDAHASMVRNGLNEEHFNIVMAHLVATLQELGVPDNLIAEAGEIAEGTRNDVLGYE